MRANTEDWVKVLKTGIVVGVVTFSDAGISGKFGHSAWTPNGNSTPTVERAQRTCRRQELEGERNEGEKTEAIISRK
jgi:hypothetical protein